jgi:hypothetical protein
MVRNVHKIVSRFPFFEAETSTTKPDLAGSKENLPGQSQVGSLPCLDLPGFVLTWQVWF